MLESLCSGDGEGEERHEERQQALYELINAGGLQHFNEDKLIALVEKAKLYVLLSTRESFVTVVVIQVFSNGVFLENLHPPSGPTQTYPLIILMPLNRTPW